MGDIAGPLAELRLFEDALPVRLFDRLSGAVRSLGSERLKGNGSYTTTFWYPRGVEPTNLAEETIVELSKLVDPPAECIGTEWWLGRLGLGKKLGFHFDRDLALKKKTGESVCPLLGSVLYLNEFPSAPTTILDQVPGPDGKSKVPEKAKISTSIAAIPNHYVVFAGNLRHGVVPDPQILNSGATGEDAASDLRLTLLVNYWHRRPLAPVCSDYDGSVYGSLKYPIAA